MDSRIFKEGDHVYCIRDCYAPIYLEKVAGVWERVTKLEFPRYWSGVIVEAQLPYVEYKVKKYRMDHMEFSDQGSIKLVKYYVLLKAEDLRKSNEISSLLT